MMKQIMAGLRLCAIIALSAITMASAGAAEAQAKATERIPAKGYAAFSNKGDFGPFEFDRHPVGDNDVLIEIMYAGICHSDLHHVWEDWRKEVYPLVPGHEIAGQVVKAGKNVKKFKVGDYAGVGCLVNSCRECDHCKKGEEQYCDDGGVLTYGAKDKYHNGEMTRGGYSDNIVVSEDFAIKIPRNAKMEKVAPLLCAGVTTYSPLKYAKVTKGDKIAVAGFGGLGHMAVQYAISFGAEVTVFDITEEKRADALKMGATKYVNVNNPKELEGLNNKFRVIISTIPTKYDPNMYVRMLQTDGELIMLGVPPVSQSPTLSMGFSILKRQKVYGSSIGGIPETQEMLDYSVQNNIYPWVEIISVKEIETAYKNVLDGKVKFRYVIDMKTLK